MQELLNYFDDADQRVRKGTSTLDSQLLNPAALAIEDVNLRLERESSVTDLYKVAQNLDNRGVYYKVQVPDTYEFQARADGTLVAPNVRAFTSDDRWKTLKAYDDLLPVPEGIATTGVALPCASLFVYVLEGDGLSTEANIGDVEFPIFLYLKVDGLDANNRWVQVQIEGKTEPKVLSLIGYPTTNRNAIFHSSNTRRPK